jgi:hypothetical protein
MGFISFGTNISTLKVLRPFSVFLLISSSKQKATVAARRNTAKKNDLFMPISFPIPTLEVSLYRFHVKKCLILPL